MTDKLYSLWDYIRGHSSSFDHKFPRLSLDRAAIRPRYDVVVVGSGYGGSIAASRCARGGQTVCVLERGKEWSPGEFPESLCAASKEIQIHPGGKDTIGESSSLYEFYVTDDLSVAQGCGLGGGSLINANVALDAVPGVFEDALWPSELKQDLDNLQEIDRKHVVEMLKPTPYPDHYPPLDKIDRMREGFGACDIEDIDKLYYKTPLYVTFEDTPSNHVGVPQPKCTGCGNCCGGCNVGAKNTLNMNYLPDAKAHGAEIFTEVEVMSVTKEPDTNDWVVKYKRIVKGSFKIEEETIRATHVIIGAGALGSTKLLLRSRERGLNVSNQIGKRFSTNGDVLGFSYNGAKQVNSVGLTTKHMTENKKAKPPGPCITSVMDFRKTTDGNVKNGFVIEDGTPPSVLSGTYTVGLMAASRMTGIDKFSSKEMLEKAWQELRGKGIDNSLSCLCMSHDNASGTISYNKYNDSVDIKWKGVGYQKNFETVNRAMEKVTEGLEGTFVKNPMWTAALGKSVVSAHPLGGCPMGESGRTGVVNHAGQVFEGDSDQVLEGLYVVDGAILPIAVGVNPTLTISCLAERCLRLLAEREGWQIDYDAFKPLDQTSFVKQKPGIRFTEKMVGTYESSNNGKQIPCEFTLTIESDDVEKMLNCDPSHKAKISGTVTCLALSSAPLTVSNGHFQLFSTSKDRVDTKEMVYKMTLTGDGERRYSFDGVKYIHKDHFGETGLKDTTTLFVKIFQLDKKDDKPDDEPLGNATLYITALNFARQLETMEIINTHSTLEKLKWMAQFGAFFSKTLWHVYGPVSSDTYFNPDAPPRKKRPLKLNGCIPKVYNCTTEDKFVIALTRYNGGSKGPVVMFHGAGVSSGIFSLDTIDTNLVEYLVQHRYDVWLVDWRTSCNLPSMVRRDYTLDDCAAFDYPAAINKVIEITMQKDVQVVAHCAGSVVCFASLLSGALEGKVRSVVASQVAANPIPCTFNKLKAGLRLPGVMKAIGVKGMTVDTDNHNSWTDWFFDKFVKGVGYMFLPYAELCHNPVCHRISFTYGLLWEHENLNPLTHTTLHEFFGYITADCSAQLALTMREKKLVSASGEDIYLPDMDKEDRLDRPAYREHINRLNMPICFIVGEKNSCYLPESTFTTFNLVKEAHPSQEYTWIQIPEYGHLDCIYGKDAVHDVYPHILKALDAHAHHPAHYHVMKAVMSLGSNSEVTDETDGPAADKGLLMTLPAEHEVTFSDVDIDEPTDMSIFPDYLGEENSSLQDQTSILDEINKLTDSYGPIQTWPSKAVKAPRYSLGDDDSFLVDLRSNIASGDLELGQAWKSKEPIMTSDIVWPRKDDPLHAEPRLRSNIAMSDVVVGHAWKSEEPIVTSPMVWSRKDDAEPRYNLGDDESSPKDLWSVWDDNDDKSAEKLLWEPKEPIVDEILWPEKEFPVNEEPSYYNSQVENLGEEVSVREMINPTHSEKNVIICLSDLHLDSIWMTKEVGRFKTFIQDLAKISKTNLHTLILLGDSLEMWLDSVDVKPKAIHERIKEWQSNDTCRILFQSVRKMADEDGVKVFYLRGNHDHEMNAETVKTLMGGNVEFIEGSLIYEIKSDDGHTYRIRFAHGHDWDIFNTYSFSCPHDPLGGRPIGYYVTRAVATAEFQESGTEEVIMKITAGLLSMISWKTVKSMIMETLSWPRMQQWFTKRLIRTALGRNISEDEYILLDDKKWIKMATVMKYPYFKRAIEKFGSDKAFSLLKGSLGKFDDFLSRCEEDVFVLGHTHAWEENEIKSTKTKDSILYVNTGTWIDSAPNFSFAYIVSPTKAKEGKVEIKRHHLNPEGIDPFEIVKKKVWLAKK